MDKKSKDHPINRFAPLAGEAAPRELRNSPGGQRSKEPAYPEARDLFDPGVLHSQPYGKEDRNRGQQAHREPQADLFLRKSRVEIFLFILCASLSGLGLGISVAFLLVNGHLDLSLKEIKSFFAIIKSMTL